MKTFLAIIFLLTISMSFQAQTFCLQLEEVSNDGANLVMSLESQGSEVSNLGSANLQFITSEGAFGAPTIESMFPAIPTYFNPSLTQPTADSYSLNIELVFPDFGLEIGATPGFTNLANLNNKESDVVIRVTDMIGKMIMSEHVTSKGNSFNHELKLNQNLPFGMYMVQIQIGNQFLVEKLIIG
ncbi:MAG: hypothetical protein ACI8XB_002102 [Patiriisocius sp.]|jgi:hypothetical protein